MPGNTLPGLPRVTVAARRRKIAKACDFCREHRIRCEAVTPCPQCVANGVACHRSRPSKNTRRSSIMRNQGRSEVQPAAQPWENSTSIIGSHPDEDIGPTPSPSANLAWTSQKTDSIMGFIARINAFCSTLSPNSPNTIPSGDGPHLDQTSPFPPSIAQETLQSECDLSPEQIKQLMKIFWTRFCPQMPIVQREDLNTPCQEMHGAPSPLQDAIIAYSLHSIYCSGLQNRIVGLNWPQFRRPKSTIGMPYFQRCLSAITQFTSFATPTISMMQCFCYLTLYLLDVGYHQAAYNMVGLGLRIAQSLNYMDSRNGGYRECQLFRRIWWTLIHLDFRCSRHVGKPVSINIDDLMCLRPGGELDDINLSNGLLFHTESIRLTAAALVMNDSIDRYSASLPSGATDPTSVESRARNLSSLLHHLRSWRDEQTWAKDFANIRFEVLNLPTDPKEALADEDQDSEQPPMINLLSTLLLLQYHNVVVGFHRVFIDLPSEPLVPKSTPKADAHAATALNHALTMIKIAHRIMATQDVLHGLSELYQYLWNAVITIVGYRLAYPYCHHCLRVREYLQLALEIFDSAGTNNFTATRAATLTRNLCTKVVTLVQVLTKPQLTLGTSSFSAPSTEPRFIENHQSDPMFSAVASDGNAMPDLNMDLLGSSTTNINMDAWPSYFNEVSEAFMDPAEFFTPHNL
ncbi:hypothetical protein N7466_006503 [Penicillium verhagenii]|uniref:uncharacterized protein n=1 Tax=Penicillium verhagenii TaxID=1562060 RepID=UPI0025457206|nr:uncharacterized protein N7466_006503 [Penicillium verhagenii]KAJ5931010.1 hypothetical protein N7466_006503 [Penicillium verhagenii]